MLEDVGPGTERLAELGPGDGLWVLGPLGRGFEPPGEGRRALLCGGGVGVAPLAILQDVLRGYPWRDPTSGRVYFRAADFLTFLQRRNFRKFEVNVIYQLLRQQFELTFEARNIKGAMTNLWSVAEPPGQQDQAFDVTTTAAVGPY